MAIAFTAGEELTADRLNKILPIVSRQSSDITSTGTTFADSSISLPVEASSVYWGWLTVVYGAVQAADMKIDWTVPSGTLIQRREIKYENPTATSAATGELIVMRQQAAATAVVVGAKLDTNFDCYFEQILIITDVTAGNCVVRYAENAASGTLTFRQHSCAVVWKID